MLRGLTAVLAAAALNFLIVYNRLLGEDVRAAPAEFLSKDFRVNTLLSDVPIHDVWVFHLQGGGDGRTLADVLALTAQQRPGDVNTMVAALVGLRMLAGGVFGWDAERHFDLSSSYISRLSPEDRARSLEEPGTRHGLFRTLYRFENESLAELMNATAHAFFCVALEPSADGYTLCWAI